MIIYNQNQNIEEVGTNPVNQPKFSDYITDVTNFNYKGSSLQSVPRAIQSPNYLSGTRGWKLFPNGKSEFN